jgi:hypothetical protein
MGVTNSPLRRRCGVQDETSAHILCECEALASYISGLLSLGPRGYYESKVWGPYGTSVKEQDYLDLASDYRVQSPPFEV